MPKPITTRRPVDQTSTSRRMAGIGCCKISVHVGAHTCAFFTWSKKALISFGQYAISIYGTPALLGRDKANPSRRAPHPPGRPVAPSRSASTQRRVERLGSPSSTRMWVQPRPVVVEGVAVGALAQIGTMSSSWSRRRSSGRCRRQSRQAGRDRCTCRDRSGR